MSQIQSSTVSFEGGGIKTVVVYAISLAPTAVGKFKLGPSQIKTKDKTYQSESFEIKVTQGKTKPTPVPPTPKETLPKSDEPQYNL